MKSGFVNQFAVNKQSKDPPSSSSCSSVQKGVSGYQSTVTSCESSKGKGISKVILKQLHNKSPNSQFRIKDLNEKLTELLSGIPGTGGKKFRQVHYTP